MKRLAVVLLAAVGVTTAVASGPATVVLAPTTRASDATLVRSAAILRSRFRDAGLHGTVTHSAGAGTIALRFLSGRPASSALSTLIERGLLEISDLEGNLVPPSIDSHGNPIPLRRRPAAPRGTVVVTCGGSGARILFCPGIPDPAVKSYYLLKHNPALIGRDLVRTGVKQDIDFLGEPIVRLRFTRTGDRVFQALTRRLYERGRLRKMPQHFVVVLDGRIVSAPQIDYNDPELANGVSGGGEIVGVTFGEAKAIAALLRVKELPVAFRVV